MRASCHFDALDRSRPFLVKEGRTALLIFAKILYNMVCGVGFTKYTKQLRYYGVHRPLLHENKGDEVN